MGFEKRLSKAPRAVYGEGDPSSNLERDSPPKILTARPQGIGKASLTILKRLSDFRDIREESVNFVSNIG